MRTDAAASADRPRTTPAGADRRRLLPPLALYSHRTEHLDASLGDRRPPRHDASGSDSAAVVVPAVGEQERPHTTGALGPTGTGCVTVPAHSWFDPVSPEFPYSTHRALLFHRNSPVSRGLAERRAEAEAEERRREETETLHRRTEATLRIQAVFRGKKVRRICKKKRDIEEEGQVDRVRREAERRREAATKIQATFRGSRERQTHTRKQKNNTARSRRQRKKTRKLAKRQQKAHQQKRRAEQKTHRARERQQKAQRAKSQAEDARRAAEKEAKEAKQAAADAEQAARATRERIHEWRDKANKLRSEHDDAQRKREVAAKQQMAAMEMQAKSSERLERAKIAQQIEAEGSNAQSQAAAVDKDEDHRVKEECHVRALQFFASERQEPMEPKPMPLLKVQITRLLEAKVIDDASCDRRGHVRRSLPGFIYERFTKDYGGPQMAQKKLQVLLEGVRENEQEDRLIWLFGMLSGMLLSDGCQDSVYCAASSCDFTLDFLGRLVPTHSAIEDELRDQDRFVSTHEAMKALEADDALRQEHMPQDLHMRLKNLLHVELERPSPVGHAVKQQRDGSYDLRIDACLCIVFRCWCSMLMQAVDAGEQLTELTPAIRTQVLKRALQQEMVEAGIDDEVQMLQQKHEEALTDLEERKKAYDAVVEELEHASGMVRTLGAEAELISSELARLELEAEINKLNARQAEGRATIRAKEEAEREMEIAEAQEAAEQAERALAQASEKEYEAIHDLEREELEQQEPESSEKPDQPSALKAISRKREQAFAKQEADAKQARLELEKEQKEADEAEAKAAKEQQEFVDEANQARMKEDEAARLAQQEELVTYKAREKTQEQAQEQELHNQPLIMQEEVATRIEAKAHKKLEAEQKDANYDAWADANASQKQEEQGSFKSTGKWGTWFRCQFLCCGAAGRRSRTYTETPTGGSGLKRNQVSPSPRLQHKMVAQTVADLPSSNPVVENTRRPTLEPQAEPVQAPEPQPGPAPEPRLEPDGRATPIAAALGGFGFMADAVRVIRDEDENVRDAERQKKIVQQYFPLKFEMVHVHRMEEAAYDIVADRARTWLKQWRANPQADQGGGVMRHEDAIAAWIYSVGYADATAAATTEEGSSEDQESRVPPAVLRKGTPEYEASCICKAFVDRMAEATGGSGKERRSKWFDEVFGRFFKHLRNATSAGTWIPDAAAVGGCGGARGRGRSDGGLVSLYLGQTAEEYRQSNCSYEIDSPVTWLRFVQATTERAQAVERAKQKGDGGLVLEIKGIKAHAAANFAAMGLSPWRDERTTDVLLVADIRLKVTMHLKPVKKGKKKRPFTSVTLEFEALDEANGSGSGSERRDSDSDDSDDEESDTASDVDP